MRRILIDCAGVRTAAEFWQRYVDAVAPDGANIFGRNLDAFWDALSGGPGWPGHDVEIVFQESDALKALQAGAEGKNYLDHLREMGREQSATKLTFD